MSIKAYFPPFEEVPDSAFVITPEIEKKLDGFKFTKNFEQYQRQNTVDTGEAVNHPKHYNSHPAGIECIDVIEPMTFNCGNAIKYIWRNGLKEGNANIQDLSKAVWYLQREIERLSK